MRRHSKYVTRLLAYPAPLLRWAMLTAMIVLFTTNSGPSEAQAPNRSYRLGHLAISSVVETRRVMLPELAKQGFIEGHNLVFDARTGPPGELPKLAQELLATMPDAIVAIGGDALRSAGDATSTVPIVSFGSDPIALGFAASLARPGGNVTGVRILGAELDAKRLDLLHEAVEAARSVAVLFPAATSLIDRRAAESEREMRTVAAKAGIELLIFTVTASEGYPAVFAAMRSAGVQALVIGAFPQFARDGAMLAALALESRLPTICEWADMAKAGCLIGFGPSRAALRQRMAGQVARIFRGATPGELPIEDPTVFEFAVNLKTARALGITVPGLLLARADEVIE